MDGPTDRRTNRWADGRTMPLIEMRGRILKVIYGWKIHFLKKFVVGLENRFQSKKESFTVVSPFRSYESFFFSFL